MTTKARKVWELFDSDMEKHGGGNSFFFFRRASSVGRCVKYNIRCAEERKNKRNSFFLPPERNAHTRARNNDPYFFVSREIRSPLIECPFLFLNGFIIAPLRGVFYSYGKSGARFINCNLYFLSLTGRGEGEGSLRNLMEYINGRWIENERCIYRTYLTLLHLCVHLRSSTVSQLGKCNKLCNSTFPKRSIFDKRETSPFSLEILPVFSCTTSYFQSHCDQTSFIGPFV